MDFSRIRIKNLVFAVKDAVARNLASAATQTANSAAANATIALTAAQEAEIAANAADDKAEQAIAVPSVKYTSQELTSAQKAQARSNIGLTYSEVAAQAPVQSVNGKTGDVQLTASDVDAKPSSYEAPVQSVNGKTGVVQLTASDVDAKPSSYEAPVQSVCGRTGDVSVGMIMDGGKEATSYPSSTGRFAVTSNIFSNITPASYYGILTIEKYGTYQRHFFTSSQDELWEGWRESSTVAEPTLWKRVYPQTTYGAVSSKSVSTTSGTTVEAFSVTLQPGVYIISYGANFPANSNGVRGIAISTSATFAGAPYTGANQIPPTPSGATWLSVTSPFNVQSTTTLHFLLVQSSGSTMNVTSAYRYTKLL